MEDNQEARVCGVNRRRVSAAAGAQLVAAGPTLEAPQSRVHKRSGGALSVALCQRPASAVDTKARAAAGRPLRRHLPHRSSQPLQRGVAPHDHATPHRLLPSPPQNRKLELQHILLPWSPPPGRSCSHALPSLCKHKVYFRSGYRPPSVASTPILLPCSLGLPLVSLVADLRLVPGLRTPSAREPQAIRCLILSAVHNIDPLPR